MHHYLFLSFATTEKLGDQHSCSTIGGVAVRNFFFCLIGALALSGSSLTQDSNSNINIPDIAGMAAEGMNMKPGSLIEVLEEHAISGADLEPNSTPDEMLMREEGSWPPMFHASTFLNDLHASVP